MSFHFGILELFRIHLLQILSLTRLSYDVLPFHPYAILVVSLACGDDRFSTLCNLLQRTGLDTPADNPDLSLTLFAPTNNAFAALPPDLLQQATDEEVAFVLRNHAVIGEEILFSELICAPDPDSVITMASNNTTQTNCGTDPSTDKFQFGDGNTQDNAPRIIRADVGACNGVVHVVNNVILPTL